MMGFFRVYVHNILKFDIVVPNCNFVNVRGFYVILWRSIKWLDQKFEWKYENRDLILKSFLWYWLWVRHWQCVNVIINQNVLLNKRKEVIVISIVTDFDIVDNILISFHVFRNIVILILLLLQCIWSHVFQSISYEKLPYTVVSQWKSSLFF